MKVSWRVAYCTEKQVRTSVGVFIKAAEALLAANLPAQAIARAYYAVQCVAEHYALSEPRLWPADNRNPGHPAERFYHTAVPDIVWQISEHRRLRGASKLDPHDCKSWVTSLLTQRMEADYRAYKDVAKGVARQLIDKASLLANEMLDEIPHILPKKPK